MNATTTSPFTATVELFAAEFDTITRDDGERRTVLIHAGDMDNHTYRTVSDLVSNVRAELDDDDAYEMTSDVLTSLAESQYDDIREARDDRNRTIECLNEVATYDIIQWLARNYSYAEDCRDEAGSWDHLGRSLDNIANACQSRAYSMILGLCCDAIEQWIENADDTDEGA